MNIILKIPDSLLPKSQLVQVEFEAFLQALVNRRVVGELRYGTPQRRQRYMSRMRRELKAYVKDGNLEQLLNIAVYCFLEAYAPENKKFHVNPSVDSVTREEFGV